MKRSRLRMLGIAMVLALLFSAVLLHETMTPV